MVKLQTKCYPKPLFEGFSEGEWTDYTIIEVSEEVFKFLNQIAIVENEHYNCPVYKVNGIEFRPLKEEDNE